MLERFIPVIALLLAFSSSCGDSECSNCQQSGTGDGTSTSGAATTPTTTTGVTPPPGNTNSDPATTELTFNTTPGNLDDTTMESCVMTGCADTERCDEQTGECINLLSPECDIVLWPEEGTENVEFVGSIMPTSPPFDGLIQPHENALELAIEEFNTFGSLQDGQNIAWVGCDSSEGTDAAVAAATHLINNVGVNAIVGPMFSEAVREVAEDVSVPAGVFLITPTGTADSISNFDDQNLVWRIAPNDTLQGNAIVDRFVDDLDPAPARMLVLTKDDAYGNELQTHVAADLVGGLSPADVYFANYPPPQTFASQEDLLTNYGMIIAQALAQPGIVTTAEDHDSPDDHYTHILVIGTAEAEALILTYLSVWAQFYPFAPFPLITVTDGAVGSMETTVNSAFATPKLAAFAPTLQTNLRGTQPLIFDAENTAALFSRYQKQFGTIPPATAGLSYDAGMATMLAMVTVSVEEEVSGAGIADGMASLVDPGGTVVSFGDPPDDFVPTARNTLAAGNTIDLVGMSGDLNWDPGNGEIRTDVLGWHVGDGEAGDPVVLDPSCLYALFPEPAEDGIWVSLPSGMPPCN